MVSWLVDNILFVDYVTVGGITEILLIAVMMCEEINVGSSSHHILCFRYVKFCGRPLREEEVISWIYSHLATTTPT